MMQSCENILFLEASENYTIIHTITGANSIHAYTLKRFEEKLTKKKSFSRIHRKFLVNSDFVVSYCDSEVTLANGQKLPISRRRQFNFNH